MGPSDGEGALFDGALRTGDRVGDLRVVRRLGVGGVGVVYEAEEGGVPVALKVLHPHLASDSTLRARFAREAHIAMAVSHPHVARVLRAGLHEDTPYLVMERVEGRPLSKILAETDADLPVRWASAVVGQVLDGLEAIHAHGAVHRDIKPANVCVDDRNHATIVDLGTAAIRMASSGPDLTPVGRAMGTPHYASPTQLAGDPADPRDDVYSAGVLLFELIARRRPFEEPRLAELCRQIQEEPVPPMRAFRQGVDPQLETLVRRAMEKQPDDRFASAAVMAAALRASMA